MTTVDPRARIRRGLQDAGIPLEGFDLDAAGAILGAIEADLLEYSSLACDPEPVTACAPPSEGGA